MSSKDLSKICKCRWLINTAHTSIYVNHDSSCSYCFGSGYTDAHGNTKYSDFPRDIMHVNPTSVNLLEGLIRSNAIWYKPSIVGKIFVVTDDFCVCCT